MNMLWLVPTLPFIGFLLLFVTGGKLGKGAVAALGAGSMLLAALLAFWIGMQFEHSGGVPFRLPVWQWIETGGLTVQGAFYLDGLSLVMMGVITGVGFLIHLFATGYMAEETDYSRFFAYMNLFVAAMLVLVLADDLLVLYIGWEGVGLCSYLLIGYNHHIANSVTAARKAFVITRIGDVGLALGIFVLYRAFGTTQISALMAHAQAAWPSGSVICSAAALLFLVGAAGKSAQTPLQTWLPDAMAGPTPVSALIHAATMVTAGVYLIARLHVLFMLAPDARFAVTAVGLLTLFIAAFAALVQTDIKRVLAYSTMSQIGYMFFALGVGAWSAGVFHLMTHAFFKALLFLSAGALSLALHHEQNLFRMGGVWRKWPLPFLGMAIGAAALTALPLTSGYFSKDAILLHSFGVQENGPIFWAVASGASFLTGLYSMRMMMLAFFGATNTEPHDHSTAAARLAMQVPIVILAVLALAGGWFGVASLNTVLPDHGVHEAEGMPSWLPVVTAGIPILGALLGWLLYRGQRGFVTGVANSSQIAPVKTLLATGWGFDSIYDALISRPVMLVVRANKNDLLDMLVRFGAGLMRLLHDLLALSENGQLRWYGANMALGTIVLLLFVVGVL